jgi:hypothetical protein
MAEAERGGDFFVSYTAAHRALAVVSAACLASSHCTDECSRGIPEQPRRQEASAAGAVEDCQLPDLL